MLLDELELDAAGSDPTTLLLDCVHRCAAMVALLGAVVGGLTPETVYGPDHLGDGRPHVAVEMYGAWVDRAARAAKLALDAGIAERVVEIEEEKGRLLADVIRQVIGDVDLGLSADQQALAVQLTARHLRAISGGVVE